MVYKKVKGEGGGGMDEEGRMIFCLQDEGTFIEGIYKGFKTVPGYEGKGKQRCHTFIQANGKQLEVIGFGLMDYILDNVDEGSQTKITYNGKVKKYHNCTVEVDDGEEPEEDINDENIPF
jgi:hypothetical protein